MSTVSRKKYQDLKHRAQQWIDKCEKLEYENQELKDQISDLKNDYPEMDEIEEELNSNRKTIKTLIREKKLIVEKSRDSLSKLEREILLKDSQIHRMEDAKKDLKDRYNELKEDFREQQRWIRQKN